MSSVSTSSEALYSSAADGELLARFEASRDEIAFATLVERYRQTVHGVCQRVLRNAQDAEDASQAAFLVLARKARSLVGHACVGGWLHEVARRTALKARGARKVTGSLDAEPATPSVSDVSVALDDELDALPKPFRETLVLCCIEGLSRSEAAKRLGVSEGAVKDRLERGREQLRIRLSRRGVTLSAGLMALFVVSAESASAAPVAAGAAHAASLFVSGASLAGLVPASVPALANGVLQAMTLQKLKLSGLAVVTFLTAGLVAQAMIVDAPDRFEKALRGHVAEIKPTSITVQLDEHEVLLNLDVASDAKVALAYEKAEYTDIKKGMYVALKLRDDHRTVREIHVLGQTREGKIVAVDAAQATVSIELDDDDEQDEKGETKPRSHTFTIAAGAIARIDETKGRLQDLEPGLPVRLELAKDLKTVNAVTAKWQTETDIEAVLFTLDSQTGKLVALVERDDKLLQQEVRVDAKTKVFIDGELKTGDQLKPNDHLVLRLSKDSKTVTAVRARRPIVEKDDD